MILLLVASHGPQAECDSKLAESDRWIYFACVKLEVRLAAFVKFNLRSRYILLVVSLISQNFKGNSWNVLSRLLRKVVILLYAKL